MIPIETVAAFQTMFFLALMGVTAVATFYLTRRFIKRGGPYGMLSENIQLRDDLADLEVRYWRNKQEYRFSQKANERHKRANRRLRDILGRQDIKAILDAEKETRRGEPKGLGGPVEAQRMVPRRVPLERVET